MTILDHPCPISAELDRYWGKDLKLVVMEQNIAGRYAHMGGTVQMFLCKTHHNIAWILISSGYFGDDDDVNDVEANRLIAEVVERGEVDYAPGMTIPPAMEKKSGRHNLEPWNAVNGKCPRCGGDRVYDFPAEVNILSIIKLSQSSNLF